jgi:alcohol dehydrogenase class IV
MLGDLTVGRFEEVRPHVSVEVARRMCAAAREARADWVLSVGGGSLASRFDLPRSRGELGLLGNEIPRLAAEIVPQVPASTPRPPTANDIRQLLARTGNGEVPVGA